MSKRHILICIFICLSLLSAGCGNPSASVQKSDAIVQDIMLASGESEISEPPISSDFVNSNEQYEAALDDEKAAIQNDIDAAKEKIISLNWLRDSYIEENPSDLESKLTRCDDLIAEAEAELQRLQEQLYQNAQNINAMNQDDETKTLSDENTPNEGSQDTFE